MEHKGPVYPNDLIYRPQHKCAYSPLLESLARLTNIGSWKPFSGSDLTAVRVTMLKIGQTNWQNPYVS